MLSQWDIEDIQRKVKKSSAGPWEPGKTPHVIVAKQKPALFKGKGQEEVDHLESHGGYAIAEKLDPGDVEFICMAKKMIPRLLDHIDEQSEIVDSIKQLHKTAKTIMNLLNDERVRVRMDLLKDYSDAYAQLMEALEACQDIEWEGKEA